jgi:hypothetical protein
MLIQLVAAALALSTSRVAADTITVGHALLRGQTIATGVDTTDVFVERDGKLQLINTSIEEISTTSNGILVVFIGKGRQGVALDSVTINRSTFAPIRHVEVFPGKSATYAFARARVSGSSKDSIGEHKTDAAIRDGLFDFSVVQQVTRLLPLKTGYEAVILAYDVAQLKERAVVYRVGVEERLTINGNEYATFKTVMDLGTHQVTRWVDAKTHADLKWDVAVANMHMVGFSGVARTK